MQLSFHKVVEDKRGKILFFSFGEKQVNFVQIKKGFARGGHFHNFESNHVLISGKIKYFEKNLETEVEKTEIYKAPYFLITPPQLPHLLIALEDTLFIESFENNYNAENFPEYRKIVKKLMNNH